MSTPIRFGYKASAEQFAPRELLEYAVLAEDVGFDSVFVSGNEAVPESGMMQKMQDAATDLCTMKINDAYLSGDSKHLSSSSDAFEPRTQTGDTILYKKGIAPTISPWAIVVA